MARPATIDGSTLDVVENEVNRQYFGGPPKWFAAGPLSAVALGGFVHTSMGLKFSRSTYFLSHSRS